MHRALRGFLEPAYLWRHLLIWASIAFAVGPIIWVISGSFDPANTIIGQRLIPREPSLANYRELFSNPQHPFPLWMWNTVKISFITAFLVVSITSLAAYAFSRFRFYGRRTGLFAILLIQMFPQMLAMVAIYLLLFWLGNYVPALGLNTHAGLIFVYLGGAMGVNVWLMKGYFDTIPTSLEEAATMDGATPFQAFYKIMLPLARPILAVIFFLTFMGTYSEYLLARVLLSSNERLTMAVGLQVFISDQYAKRWGVFSAAALIGAIPIIVLFALLQKQLVSGLTRGAVKG
ncbi:MAG: maltose ABC transporter permease MalG [Bacillota bacterium]|nr:maltose ABC transporter permease MalG [Bacillota bacterium]